VAALMCVNHTTLDVPTTMLQQLSAILQLSIAKARQMTSWMTGDGEQQRMLLCVCAENVV
jgi:hypothetical protein